MTIGFATFSAAPASATPTTPGLCDGPGAEQCRLVRSIINPYIETALTSSFTITNQYAQVHVTDPDTGEETFGYSFTCTSFGANSDGQEVFGCEDTDGNFWLYTV